MKCPNIEIQAFLDGEATTNLMFNTQFFSDSFYDAEDWKKEYSKDNYLEVLISIEEIYLRKAILSTNKNYIKDLLSDRRNVK